MKHGQLQNAAKAKFCPLRENADDVTGRWNIYRGKNTFDWQWTSKRIVREKEFQIETLTSGSTTTIDASEREERADAPAIDHVTTSAAVVSKRENAEIAETSLPNPTVVHATPAGKEEIEGRSVAGKYWKRNKKRNRPIHVW